MKKAKVKVSVNYQTSHRVANLPSKTQASDKLVSSDAESEELTAKQINTEVSERTQRVTTQLNLTTKAADFG